MSEEREALKKLRSAKFAEQALQVKISEESGAPLTNVNNDDLSLSTYYYNKPELHVRRKYKSISDVYKGSAVNVYQVNLSKNFNRLS